MSRGVAVAVALALPALLAGCVHANADLPFGRALSGPATPSAPWTPGSFWTYHATFKGGRSIDVALVVHEARPDGYLLGTNLSAGFFGLPFNGTVTRANLNPVVAGEEWRLFQFPLVSGKEWEYELFGHRVRTSVATATLATPGGSLHAGFDLETTAYGRTFARYTYSPHAQWFTRLTLIEPTDGSVVLDVALTGWGERFGGDYFVQVPVAKVRHAYPEASIGVPCALVRPLGPDAPCGGDRLSLPAGARLLAVASLRGEAGEFAARLASPRGTVVLEAAVHGQGAALERASFLGTPGDWRFDHVGAGKGSVRLDVTAVVSALTGAPPTSDREDETVRLLPLLEP